MKWEQSSTAPTTIPRKLESDSPRPAPGSVPSSGSAVSYALAIDLMIDHAHPTFIAGHPFKGGWIASTGFLANPEMARFQINSPYLFSPPNPAKVPGAPSQLASCPTFANFFQSYFGNAQYNLSSPKAGKFLEGLKKCFENNSQNPADACTYYINGFKRAAATN